MNKNFTQTLLIAAAMIGFSMSASAQESAVGTSTATVIEPLTITKGADLAFGLVTEYGAGGTITVAAGATTSAVAGAGAKAIAGGTVTAGSFIVTGQAGESYQVTLPLDDVVTLTSATATGSTPMAVQTFETNLTGTPVQGTIDADGTFYVGAVLHLNADQAAATDYTGSYTVTVQYL